MNATSSEVKTVFQIWQEESVFSLVWVFWIFKYLNYQKLQVSPPRHHHPYK